MRYVFEIALCVGLVMALCAHVQDPPRRSPGFLQWPGYEARQ